MLSHRLHVVTKFLVPTAVLAVLAAALGGCSTSGMINGNGKMTDGSVAYDGAITTINVSDVTAELALSPASGSSVTYTIDENLAADLSVAVSDGVLTIKSKDGKSLNSSHNITFNVSSDKLAAISTAGSVKVTGQGTFTADTFKLDVSGAATGTLALSAQDVSLTISGAANMELTGTTNKLEIKNSGAAVIKARGLASQDATVSVDGAGTVEVSASGTLDASVSGVGTVTYWGNPTLSENTSGVASVKQGS